MTDPLLLTTSSHIATITLNEPERRNAMGAEMTAAFPSVVKQIANSDARVVIVTGAGSAFCAGGNLDFLHSGPPDVHVIRDKMTSFYPQFLSLLDLDIPVVAAINGHAIGAGFCLALMADLRLAAVDAKMSMPFVKIGIHPGMMATALLSRATTGTHASDLLYTGRMIDGEEAYRMGIVNRVAAKENLLAEATALATELAANAPIAMRYLKQGLRLAFANDASRAQAWEGWAQPATMNTSDVKEGLAAVKEKRQPSFKGA